MEYSIFIEFFGSLFAILGAFFMSNKEKMKYAGISFYMANLFGIILAFLNAMGPLLIQTLIIMISTLMIIRNHTEEEIKAKVYIGMIISLLLSIAYIVIYGNLNIGSLNMFKSNFEIIVSIIVIMGSFFLSSKLNNGRIFAFACFIIADISYIYIGYSHNLSFFTLQFVFFIAMSAKGIVAEIKEKRCLSLVRS